MTNLLNCAFFVKQCIDLKKQSNGGALKVLAKSLKTAFNKDHFIVNLVYQISIKNGKMT